MHKIWEIIAEIGIELHPDRISVIADKIKSLGSVGDFSLLKPYFGPNIDQDLVNGLHLAWQKAPQTEATEIAAALLGASAASSLSEHRGAVELVWTGPSTGIVPVRHTEQVLCEVIESANRRLFLISFVAYEVDSITRALREAVGRQVQINVLLELSTEHGGRVTFDSINAMKRSVPSANIYTWNPDPKFFQAGKSKGSVHAKCAVADGKLAFITSANLSVAAMEKNIELGLLVRGGNLPMKLEQLIDSLAETNIIKQTGQDF